MWRQCDIQKLFSGALPLFSKILLFFTDAKDDEVEEKPKRKFFSGSTLSTLSKKFGSKRSVKFSSGNQSVVDVDVEQQSPKGDNKLGRHFKQQNWYSNFLEKPIIEKIQAKLPFTKKGLKEIQKTYDKITENLEDMVLHQRNGQNDEQFVLMKEIGSGSFGVVYSAKRVSDEKEVRISKNCHFFKVNLLFIFFNLNRWQ